MTERRALFLPRTEFQSLLDALAQAGYRVVGPRVGDGAVIYGDLTQAAELPRGIIDRQSPGRYRLEADGSPRWFRWANGPQALKPFLFAPRETVWRVRRDATGALGFEATEPDDRALAVIGVRACDLAALALQDAHFLRGAFPDPYYARRRERLLLVAVHCAHAAETCFCASTGDGPRAERGFDIALGELDDGFVAEASTERGEAILGRLQLARASAAQVEQSHAEVERAASEQTRRLPSTDLREKLFGRLDHARWSEVAERCLACGNCTSVCPTCFCHAQHEVPALDGRSSEHVREWDSCFTRGHSYLHGFTVRPDTRSRYRQWLTHKLAGWHEQYGRSGCVGCGRCIAWCPVGIDITEEAAAICGDGA